MAAQIVSAFGRNLYLNGNIFKSVGVNRYNLLNGTICAGLLDSTVPTLFSEWQQIGVTTVRFWMFQSHTKSGTDFTRFDTLLSLANQYGIKLIPVFENQWADCTQGGIKSSAWYQSGYLSPYGTYPLSLKDYIANVVSRYKDHAVIMAWQIMNEAEDPDTAGFYHFATDVSSSLKSLDPNHLVSFGTMGSGQAGTSIYRTLHALPTIDLLEYHDYNAETTPLPSTLQDRINDSIALNKPLFIGESGISLNKYTQQQRADLFNQKMTAFFNHGGAAYLIWSYRGNNPAAGGEFDFTISDPLAQVMKNIAAGFSTTPTPTPTPKEQSAKNCWNSIAGLFGGTAPSYGSGIAKAWQALYAAGKKPGPPLTPEYGSVDWSGKAIRVQEFANTRCEWDGQAH